MAYNSTASASIFNADGANRSGSRRLKTRHTQHRKVHGLFVELTKGATAQIDDEDADLVGRYKWHAVDAGGRLYAVSRVNGRRMKMHRLILGDPEGLVVDHINGDSLDNRRKNLRAVSQSFNIRNSSLALGRGVWKCETTGRWAARVSLETDRVFLGRYSFEHEARAAVDEARCMFDMGVPSDDIRAHFKAKAKRAFYGRSLEFRERSNLEHGQ